MYLNNVIQKRLKVWLSTLLLLGASMNFMSCGGGGDGDSTTKKGYWELESSIDAGNRTRPVIFTIGDSLYIATGYNGTNGKVFYNDLWVYNNETVTWEKRADLPGSARSGAVAFSANGKGYLGLGYDGENYLKDFWSYNPVTNAWTQVADFKGTARDGAIAFSIDNKGYVGTGADATLTYKDFYQYDDVNNTWIAKPSVQKTERTNAFCFVIDGKAYVGGGVSNSTLVEDLYEYDPIGGSNGTGIWIEKNDLKDDKVDTDTNDKGYAIARESGVAFVIDGKAYVTLGKRANQFNLLTWEYNPSTDTWKQMTAFVGSSRQGAIAFTLGNKGYVGAGYNGTYLNDLWSFDPTLASN